MSTENNICAPRLRFPGFSGEWVEKKLGEVGSFIRGLSYNNSEVTEDSSNTLIIRSNNIIPDSVVDCINGLVFVTKSPSKEQILRKGDVVICLANGSSNLVGKSSCFDGDYKGTATVGAFCGIYRSALSICQYLVQTAAYKEKISLIKQGGNGALANLYGKDILNLEFPFPSPEEQDKIVKCLLLQDELIVAQKQNVDALKEEKKGLMQQLFPQNGEVTPRLRFPGFVGDWEERELNECFEERNEQLPEDKEYPLMAFIAGKGVSPKGEKYDRSALVKDAANKKYKRTEYGDFIYSSNNLEAGSIGFNSYGKACISPVYSIFKSKNIVDFAFIGTLLTQKSFIAKMVRYRQGVVYGQWKIPEREFLGIKVNIPSLAEQKKIAECLSALDDRISAESAKLEALKDHKKGLMQQLFPQPAK